MKPKDQDQNAKDDAWKPPVDLPYVKPEDYPHIPDTRRRTTERQDPLGRQLLKQICFVWRQSKKHFTLNKFR